jgi:hypothetical protein
VRNSWADVDEEGGFGTIDFRERLGAFLLLFISACRGNARRNLPGHEIQKSGIADVERAIWVQCHYDDARRNVLGLARDGQQNCPRGRLTPDSRRYRYEALRQILHQEEIFLVENF